MPLDDNPKPDAEPGETPNDEELENKDDVYRRQKYGPFYELDGDAE